METKFFLLSLRPAALESCSFLPIASSFLLCSFGPYCLLRLSLTLFSSSLFLFFFFHFRFLCLCLFPLHVSMSLLQMSLSWFLAGSAGPWFLVPSPESPILECRLALIFPRFIYSPSLSCLAGDELLVPVLKQTGFFLEVWAYRCSLRSEMRCCRVGPHV